MRRNQLLALLVSVSTQPAFAQVLTRRPAEPAQPPTVAAPTSVVTPTMSLIVPVGTPLKVALDKEVRVQDAGQLIHAKVVEPVYAFDKVVVPAGSEVVGHISEIDSVSKTARTIQAMNANFSPRRQVHVLFDTLQLADGRTIPLKATVSPASQGTLQFVSANSAPQTKTQAAHSAASREVTEVRKEIKTDWESAKNPLHAPGKVHRFKRLAVAQLPYHPQYMEPGTTFDADLQQPLDFGTEPVAPDSLSQIGTELPPGSTVHALLVTPLSSATTRKGDPVEAVISQPLFVSDHLVLPEGSRLQGSVLQARPARRLGRNGQLRIVFHRVVPPNGVQQALQASLEGVEVSNGEHLSLDSEGGAQVVTPKTRYLTTGLAIALASSSLSSDHDRDFHPDGGGGDVGGGAANGASGFGLVGTLVGALAHSRAVASAFGVYGASMSVYSHFLAKGHDVVYPKDMAMMIGLGAPATQNQKPGN